ncbi:hypothetical protein [Actinomadura hibisca]|uniref:hypothetical protein n=1 Tax=Actinomadura hibisca TaxID=68565 RepID=UPI000AFBD478|nr:hypothetical protein [Actinomadura hibisca]
MTTLDTTSRVIPRLKVTGRRSVTVGCYPLGSLGLRLSAELDGDLVSPLIDLGAPAPERSAQIIRRILELAGHR